MLNRLSSNRKLNKLFEALSHELDIVHFGTVEASESDDPVKGLSFSDNIHDSHFLHGNVNGYDISIVQRNSKVRDHQDKPGDYDWTVFKLHLKTSGLPHIFVDAHQYDEVLYNHIFAKFGNLRMANNLISTINQSFADSFHTFVSQSDAQNLPYFLSDPIMQRMLTHFHNVDVEIDDTDLYLYLSGIPERLDVLKAVVNEALWLAEHVEWVQQQLTTAS